MFFFKQAFEAFDSLFINPILVDKEWNGCFFTTPTAISVEPDFAFIQF
tara:strand:+ start:199 stop:342 length:144 start_codon:yes stop_codon:yes gene_type:complete